METSPNNQPLDAIAAAEVAESIITECTIGDYSRVETFSQFFEQSILRPENYTHLGDVLRLIEVWRKKCKEQTQQ